MVWERNGLQVEVRGTGLYWETELLTGWTPIEDSLLGPGDEMVMEPGSPGTRGGEMM